MRLWVGAGVNHEPSVENRGAIPVRPGADPSTIRMAYRGASRRGPAHECKAILAGECDDWRESSLYMIGDLEEGREKERAARSVAA